MKKILVASLLAVLGIIVLNSRTASHISAEMPAYSNRTVQELVKLSKTDNSLLAMLETYSDDVPIIEYNGGFFTNENETKETYEVEMRSEDGTQILFSDTYPATVGEVREAILENQ